jgi:hypothetical protein
MGESGGGQETNGESATEDLVAAARSFAGADLRDLWVFDREDQRALYVRDDVAENLADETVERYIDNERLGYVSRDTYDALHYAEFQYTVRGFDHFEQFRTFLADDGIRVGVIASVDAPGEHDFSTLVETIHEVAGEHGVAALAPGAD